MPRRTAALASAVISLLPAGQPLLLGTLGITTATTAVVLDQGAALAQDASVVARVAKQVTVVVAGASSPGSGVLIKKSGNRYTVLTAWHVIKDTSASEVIEIKTPDSEWHESEIGSIKRLGKIDLAVLTFESPKTYEIVSVGNVEDIDSGNQVFVSGFPLPTSSIPVSVFRFLKGDVIANATVAIPDGYQLLYSNPTLPGMSGGSVLNRQGQLVGIHGRSEKDDKVSLSTGKAVSTGTNQAVPISFYKQFDAGQSVSNTKINADSADDYLAQVRSILSQSGKEREVISLANQSLLIKQSAEGYFFRAIAKFNLNDYQGALSDMNETIKIKPLGVAYYNRSVIKKELKDCRGVISDSSKAIQLNARAYQSDAYALRADCKGDLSDYKGALSDYSEAISIDSKNIDAMYNRGRFRQIILKDLNGAIADYNRVISINPKYSLAYQNRGAAHLELKKFKESISDSTKAISIDPLNSDAYANRGAAQYFLKNYREANVDLNKAILLEPQNTYAFIVRSAVNTKLGDNTGACHDLRKAVSLGSKAMLNVLNSEEGARCR